MRTYRLVLTAMVVGAALTLSACGGDDSASSSSTTAAAGATTASTTTTTAAENGGEDLEGTWVIDAGAALASATANVGGTGGSVCSGQLRQTFDNGTWKRGGNITCGNGIGTIDGTGTYRVDGDKLIVTSTSSNSRLTIRGVSVPIPDGFGNATATYKVVGDTLTITFTQASVGTVTSKYTRAS